MPRVKGGYTTRRRRKRLLEQAKGNQGARSKLFKSAKEAVHRALVYAYRDRHVRKRDFRKLWIIRIGAAVREYGLSYSKFIRGLSLSQILLNRKSLSEMAISDKVGFGKIVDIAKKAISA
jgi:large subunit ribosomal protein L20